MIQELVNHCHSCYDLEVGKVPFDKAHCVSCEDCLKEIHYPLGTHRQYDCIVMCHYYVCHNIYRYATEMLWLFHEKALGFKARTSPIKMCSIGCGPCSELVAFEEYYKNKDLPFEFTYDGFDTNRIWNPVQKYVKSISTRPENITFHNEDVFDYYAHCDTKPNVIILNYMLSDMLNHDKDGFQTFFNKLSEFIKQLPSCAILVNDINLGQNDRHPRYYYQSLINMVSDNLQPDRVVISKAHFADSIKKYYRYGDNQRARSSILFKNPDEISSKFATNTECHSAQLLIIKKKQEAI